MVKIYTKTGDSGTSGLYSGERLAKDSLIFDVLGENDELSSRIGCLIASIKTNQYLNDEFYIKVLRNIQKNIQTINSIIATIDKKNKNIGTIEDEDIESLESDIDNMTNILPELKNFIMPGSYETDALSHMCRTQSRKCERFFIKLINDENITSVMFKGCEASIKMSDREFDKNIQIYLNRLSDYFFTLARYTSYNQDEEE